MNGVSFAALDAQAAAWALHLRDKGVGMGDRVATTLTGLDFARLMHALPKIGAVLVPLNTRLTKVERAAVLDSARPALVVDAPLPHDSRDIDRNYSGQCRESADPDEVFAVIHTSGTTGRPKAVELTYGNFHASALANAVNLGVEREDRWLCCMPLFHVGGVSILTRSAINQTEAIVHEGFDVDKVKKALAGERITLVSLVPTQLSRLLDAGVTNPPSLRAALIGGGPVAQPLMKRASAAGIPVIPTYGMTETCSQVWTGKPLPGAEIVNGPGSELLIRGPMVATTALADDGWLHTGDRGHIDPDGRLTVEGRIADTIVTGGENVAAAEVEEALISHPSVEDVAVVGRPDPEWGQVVTAFVVGEVAAEDLRAHARSRLAGYKIPKRIEQIGEIPRNAAGKILRGKLPE
ncbi:MAG: o-succinylbenzoate---CoA ligase [Thermoleophilaceae bacterium]|nr:o-succinylbenzoate---CoA ligase [Thermoleophilaceae bacterium]